jgi:DNA-directed RNA polymerase specialized sigma24 family protein
MLLEEIMPIVAGTVPRVARPLHGEDREELVQDTLATAAKMLDDAERGGILPPARSIAYYAIQRTKSGRRSYGGHRLNPLSAGFSKHSSERMLSLDAEMLPSADAEGRTLGDFIVSSKDDPATECARKLDWRAFLETLDRRHRTVFTKTAVGVPCKEIARTLGVSSACISQMKGALAAKARAYFGVDSLSKLTGDPEWKRRARAHYESRVFTGLLANNAEGIA